jgi:prepilin-type N-terminal cleavage/methylation domain-containing protein|tara:strand:+ start:247 stop:1035 length:789 start_codon:yes stop_codon:yes gene_type:complete
MTSTSNTTCQGYEIGSPYGRRGFSLLELIVVISITTLLMGLLLPTLSSVRENAHRVICGANQRQFGQAITMYSGDHRNRLPVASVLDLPEPDPSQLSLVRTGSESTGVLFVDGTMRAVPEPLKESDWDALGRLYQWHYCAASETYYCPSHNGEHLHDDCKDKWESAVNEENLYSNYQYVGHKDWRTGKRRSLLEGNELVLLTDGMRTKSDYSHGVGHNELRGDGSVSWKDDVIIRTKLFDAPPVDFDGMRNLNDLIYLIFTK